MTHGVKYFVWRDGRPRWSPGAHTRSRGFKGKDLKDDDGNWLPLKKALLAAHELNRLANVRSEMPTIIEEPNPRSYQSNKRGYVYFILVGQKVKIGFATNPAARLQALRTGFPEEVDLHVAVPGTMWEEFKIHETLTRYRLNGEWFEASQVVMNLILRCVKARRVVFGRTEVKIPYLAPDKA